MNAVVKWFRKRRDQRRFRLRAIVVAALQFESGSYEMMRLTGLRVVELYPTLYELEDLGIIVGEWEAPDDTTRPRRRLYRIADKAAAP